MHKEHTNWIWTELNLHVSLEHVFVRINQDVTGLWPLGVWKVKRIEEVRGLKNYIWWKDMLTVKPRWCVGGGWGEKRQKRWWREWNERNTRIGQMATTGVLPGHTCDLRWAGYRTQLRWSPEVQLSSCLIHASIWSWDIELKLSIWQPIILKPEPKCSYENALLAMWVFSTDSWSV